MRPSESNQHAKAVKRLQRQLSDAKDDTADVRFDTPTEIKSSSAQKDDLVGSRIGRYEVMNILGVGGMGVVLKARDTSIGRDVAIKVLPAELSDDQVALNRFLAEAKSAGKLNHPNVVTIHEIAQTGSLHYLVMEAVTGGTAADYIEQHGAYPVAEATRIAMQSCQGLAAAHKLGLIHRDIKPANLLIAEDGTVKVSDFGLAKRAQSDSLRLTEPGQIVGTPYYMSPEQCESGDVDGRSDIYSLGASYYCLLTGKNPYQESGSVVQVMYSHCHAPPPDPREIRSSVPPACYRIIERAMAARPDDRYQTIDEMHADLESLFGALSGTTIHLPSDSQPVVTSAAESRSSSETKTATATESAVANVSTIAWWRRPTILLSSAALAACLLIAVWAFASQGREGTLLFEINDPQSAIAIKGTEIVVRQTDAGDDVTVESGEKTLIVTRNGQRFETDRFVLDGSDAITVRLEVVGDEVRVWQGDRLIGRQLLETASIESSKPRPPLAIAPFDNETAKQHQRAWADYLDVPIEKQIELPGGGIISLMLIPPGEFVMGSSEQDRNLFLEKAKPEDFYDIASKCIRSEGPAHHVRIAEPFWLGRYEVTVGQFRRFVDATGYQTEAERTDTPVDGTTPRDPRMVWNRDFKFPQTDRSPVANVSWGDAMAFTRWLSNEAGMKFGLATEAQWEYACRAGTNSYWYFGDGRVDIKNFGWCTANARGKTHPVGQLRPNNFGLHDMHGNVWEWCSDWYGPDYYAVSPYEDPRGNPTGSERVIRGGAWSISVLYCRSALRYFNDPNGSTNALGIRVAAPVETDR